MSSSTGLEASTLSPLLQNLKFNLPGSMNSNNQAWLVSLSLVGAACWYVGWRSGRRCSPPPSPNSSEFKNKRLALSRSISDLSSVCEACEMPQDTPTEGSSCIVLAVRSDLGMGLGKCISQCCRAFWGELKKIQKYSAEDAYNWEQDGSTIFVYRVESEEGILQLRKKTKELGMRSHIMQDKNMQNQKTAIAIGPSKLEVLKDVTQYLKLM